MTICDNGHAEIVFTGRLCPVCAFVENIEAEEACNKGREAIIEKLQNEIEELKAQFKEAQIP